MLDFMRPIPEFPLMPRASWSSAHSDSTFFSHNMNEWGMKLNTLCGSLLTILQHDSYIRKLNFQEIVPSSSRFLASFSFVHSL